MMPILTNHRKLAEAMGEKPRQVVAWIRTGHIPPPHSTVAKTHLFRCDFVDHYLTTGHWPQEAWPKPEKK